VSASRRPRRHREAIRRGGHSAQVHFDLGRVYVALNKEEEALKQLTAAVRADAGFAPGYDGAGQILAGKGQLDDAIAQYQKAINADPGFAPAWEHLARAHLERRAYVAAFDALVQAFHLDPSNLLLLAPIGNVLPLLSDPNAAIGRIQAIVDATLNASVADYWATTLAVIGKKDLAADQFVLALTRNPADDATYADLAWASARLDAGWHDALIPRVQKVVDSSADPRAHRLWAQTLVEFGKPAEALGEIVTALRKDPTDEETYQYLRRPLLDDAVWRGALMATLQADVDAGRNYLAEARWGELLLALVRPADAIDYFERAAAHGGVSWKVQAAWGEALIQMGRRDDGIPHLIDSVRSGETAAWPGLRAALPTPPAAWVDRIQEAVNANPAANNTTQWARTLIDLGERERALDELKRSLETDAEWVAAYDGLIAFNSAFPNAPALTQLLDAWDRQVEQRRNPAIDLLWADALRQLGKAEEAMKYVDRAVEALKQE